MFCGSVAKNTEVKWWYCRGIKRKKYYLKKKLEKIFGMSFQQRIKMRENNKREKEKKLYYITSHNKDKKKSELCILLYRQEN